MTERENNQHIRDFHKELTKVAVEKAESLTGVERSALEQHFLLSQMTNIPWKEVDNLDAIMMKQKRFWVTCKICGQELVLQQLQSQQ